MKMVKITITIKEVKEGTMVIEHDFKPDEDTTLPEMLAANAMLAASLKESNKRCAKRYTPLEPEACRD